MSALESKNGKVSEFKTMSVKPDNPADLIPFSKSSLSSRPGSPKQTLESSHPIETCKFSLEIIVLAGLSIFLSMLVIMPFSI